MIFRIALAAVAWFFIIGPITAGETLVKDVAEFDTAMKSARPGDTIVLADGEWRDAKLVVRGEGTRDAQITVRPQTPGKVAFVGASTLRIGGRYLVVRDLLWKDCEAESEVIAFRIDSKTPAWHCGLVSCAVIGDRPAKGDRKWVSLYGEVNSVEHCRFEGKQSPGTLLVVWLGEKQPPNAHTITFNFFGPRQKLGKNGGEIIRVGDSKTSMQRSWTFTGCNYFYHCDGEAEIISNKSCENVYQQNVFVGCGGALTLRHGNQCDVSQNLFFGDGRKGTGGVRVIGENHRLAYNLFHGLEGDDARAAVSLMNGLPDSPLNGYFQVKNVRLEANTFIDCKESLVLGLSDEDRKNQTLSPVDISIGACLVVAKDRPVFVVHGPTDGVTHRANFFHGGELGIASSDGWKSLPARPQIDLAKLEIPRVWEGGGKAEVETAKFHDLLDGVVRPGDVGPAWMRPGDEFLPAVWKGQEAKSAVK